MLSWRLLQLPLTVVSYELFTTLKEERIVRETVKWHFSTGLLFSGTACELKRVILGRNEATPKPQTLCLPDGLQFGPGA